MTQDNTTTKQHRISFTAVTSAERDLGFTAKCMACGAPFLHVEDAYQRPCPGGTR